MTFFFSGVRPQPHHTPKGTLTWPPEKDFGGKHGTEQNGRRVGGGIEARGVGNKGRKRGEGDTLVGGVGFQVGSLFGDLWSTYRGFSVLMPHLMGHG